jgi:periplasmic protein TonB
MGAALLKPEVAPPPKATPSAPTGAEFRFHSLVVSEPTRIAGRRSATLGLSITMHAVLILAIVVVPLYFYDFIPDTAEGALRAFFVAPPDVAPPPPPPPPPPPASALRPKVAPPTELKPIEPAAFTAPIEVPDKIMEEPSGIDLGVEGGVPGGVEGGVPGGVIGGIVGGLPQAQATPLPERTVRIGGQIVAPKRVHVVEPVYPELAKAARVSAIIILEALVGMDGRVKGVKILRGHPLLDTPATEAVQQWRYKPLLLNGEPTQFILTVTVVFNIQQKAS